jgi:hypothetical protein
MAKTAYKAASEVRNPRGGYTVHARFESSSKPGTYHEIRTGADGVRYCTCRGYIVKKNQGILYGCTHFSQRPDLRGDVVETATVALAQGVAIGGRPAPIVEVPAAPVAPAGRYVPRASRPAPAPSSSVAALRTRDLPRATAPAAVRPAPAPLPTIPPLAAAAETDGFIPAGGYVPRGRRLEID